MRARHRLDSGLVQIVHEGSGCCNFFRVSAQKGYDDVIHVSFDTTRYAHVGTYA